MLAEVDALDACVEAVDAEICSLLSLPQQQMIALVAEVVAE